MGQIPEAFIEEVRARSDIAVLIAEHIPLRRAGANLVGCCPFHQEKTPSFSVSPSKQFYHCFGCGVSGDVLSFIQQYEGLSFVEAVLRLADRLGLSVPSDSEHSAELSKHAALYGMLAEAKLFYQKQLQVHALAPKVQDYLRHRGLGPKIIEQFSMGFAPPTWDALCTALGTSALRLDHLQAAGLIVQKKGGGFYDRFRDRVLFPIHDKRGRVCGFGGRALGHHEGAKYLNSPETPVFNKGKTLYGLYEARVGQGPLNQLLIVEGYMDVVSVSQSGMNQVVATLGTALTTDQVAMLFQQAADLVFCFDGDAAGQAAAKRSLALILPHMKEGRRARFMILPATLDPDALIQQQGAKAFSDHFDQSRSLSDFLFDCLSSDLDLNRLENRAQLVTRARPLIERMPDGVLQQMFYKHLAELARIDLADLQSTVAASAIGSARSAASGPKPYQQHQRAAGRPPVAAVRPALKSLVERAIVLLTHRPGLIRCIAANHGLEAVEVPDMPLFCAIIGALHRDPQALKGGLAQPWADQLDSQFSDENRRTWLQLIPEEGLEQEFLGVLQRLKERAEEQMMERVLVKARAKTLTLEEKQYLNHCLIQRNKNRVDYVD